MFWKHLLNACTLEIFITLNNHKLRKHFVTSFEAPQKFLVSGSSYMLLFQGLLRLIKTILNSVHVFKFISSLLL